MPVQGARNPQRTALARAGAIPELQGRPFSIHSVTGRSLNNELWRIDTADQRFALRIPPAVDMVGINRDDEVQAHRAAAAVGAAPALIGADPSGVLLVEWIEGEECTGDEFADRETFLRAATLTASTHVPAPSGMRTLSAIIAEMLARAEHLGVAVPSSTEAHIERQREREMRARSERAPVLTHNDPWPNNFMNDGHRLWLIDWEFAGASDGMNDFAVLAMSAGWGPEAVKDGIADELLEVVGRPGERSGLSEAMWSVNLFEAVWSLAMSAGQGGDVSFDYAAHSAMSFDKL